MSIIADGGIDLKWAYFYTSLDFNLFLLNCLRTFTLQNV